MRNTRAVFPWFTRMILPSLLFTLFLRLSCHAALPLLTWDSAVISWTNSAPDATYRMDYTQDLLGPWNNLTNIGPSNAQIISVTLDSSTTNFPHAFYRVVWQNPPAPQPVGNWIYKGYTSDSLVVTGLVTFAASDSGSLTFQKVVTSRHPTGSGTFQSTLATGNSVDLSVSGLPASSFTLSGQMVGGAYQGQWVARQVIYSIPGGNSGIVTYQGTFIAERAD